MPFPEPQRTEVGGVPVWFTDVPGPCMGGLVFRVGKADESLVTSGISHVIEHLALAPLMTARLSLNGAVSALTTEFVVSGDQGLVESFLMQVCQNLSSLPYERLDLERRVLQTEAQMRGQSFGQCASVRFGAKGIGLHDWKEMGLEHLDADRVDAWRTEWFTRSNAVVWMTRPPSDALWLPMPDGERHPPPKHEPLADLKLPAHIHIDAPFIGCSMLTRRSMPLFVALRILYERGIAKLRIERGLTYAIQYHEDRVGLHDSSFNLYCDTPFGHTSEAIDAFVDLLDDVAGGDLTDEEVMLACDAMMPWRSPDPGRPANEASRMAVGDLIGHTPTSWDELAAEGAELVPNDVSSTLEAALASSILAVPEGEAVPARFTGHPLEPRSRTMLGRMFVRWDGNAMDQVVFGDRGVSRSLGAAYSSTIDFDECVLAAFAPNGTMWLVDERGEGVVLELNQLVHGRELAAAIRGRVPQLVVDIQGDALGWFELQSMVEEHDTISVRARWRELETLAETRGTGERVLLVALADHGKDWKTSRRGILAVTDRRVLHVAHDRKDQPVAVLERTDIAWVGVVSGLLGVRLEIRMSSGDFLVFERIRPRASAADLELLLTPVGQDEDPGMKTRPGWPERPRQPARPSGPTRSRGPIP